jgi:hypothetical protein
LLTWLIAKTVDRLRETGVATLNLGGGVRPGDGLFQFKQKFGVADIPLAAVHQIYDHEKYADLVRQTGAGETNWFPAYRMR